jgi:enoyl-CoA hydratase/carnithine racemase
MNQHGFELHLDIPSEGVGLIRFRDEERQNQLCWALIEALAEMLENCAEQGVKVVVLSSDNPGHWFEHAWLSDIHATFSGQGEATGDGGAWFGLMKLLAKGPLVTIAAINGDTCGGGAEVGWACDLRVAERQARFSQPEVRLGITPGVGGASRLSKLAGRTLATEMVLGGDWTSAERIHQVGAVNHVVEEGQARQFALDWATRIAAMPANALRACKQVLAETEELPLQEALAVEQSHLQATAQTEEALSLMQAQQQYYNNGGTTSESFES